MGHNTVESLMNKISESAQLSQKYTNHSLRATAVHILDAANFPSRHIMTVTGHRAESSLKTYTGYTDSNIKQSMSNEISKSMRGDTMQLSATVTHTITSSSEYTAAPAATNLACEPVINVPRSVPISPPECETSSVLEELQNFDIDIDALFNDNNTNIVNTSNVTTHVPPFHAPVFNNCSNITINFNLNNIK